MNSDDMFNAVLDEYERVTSRKINYSESWISKLDGEYPTETRDLEVTCGYSNTNSW